MPKGERVLTQSKRTTPPPISKFKKKFFYWYLMVKYLKDDFSIG
jgi:hypothetical protein